MNLLQAKNIFKQFGLKTLFDGASFSINQGEHVGVIGPNGAGKTTLFKALVGAESLDSGEITKMQGLRIGYLEQEAEWSLEISANEYLESECQKPIWELKQIGTRLGLTEEHFSCPMNSLSGGYRMRMKLLYLIGLEPELMLLDEPTNFLDLESVLALETFLQDFSGAFLLISHDREFLKRTTDSTLEIEAGQITKFPGNIDDYFEQKTELESVLRAQALNQETKRKQIQDFVSRFGAKATKAKQAQSRLKQLEKMEKIELKKLPVRASIQIPPPIHTGKESLALESADLGYATKKVLQNVNLRLERGDHLGVVGVNGAGKSTLLKSLAGTLEPLRGTRRLGYQVTLSHFSQHSTDQLKLDESVMDALERGAHPDLVRQDILNMAGSLLFSGDDLYKKVRVLSGGEKSRVALGQVLLKKSPLLLLDEPTNHLDFETVESLTYALSEYAGSLIVVSHDRGFISRVATKILEINTGHLRLYPGSYDDYLWSLQNGALKDSATLNNQSVRPSESMTASATPLRFNYRDEVKRLQSAIKTSQKEIEKIEKDLAHLKKSQHELNQELLKAKGAQAAGLARDLGLCSENILVKEDQLLAQMEQLDQQESTLKIVVASNS